MRASLLAGAQLCREAGKACFERADLLEQQRQRLAQQGRDGAVRIGGHPADLLAPEA